jgi:hypothetical protein
MHSAFAIIGWVCLERKQNIQENPSSYILKYYIQGKTIIFYIQALKDSSLILKIGPNSNYLNMRSSIVINTNGFLDLYRDQNNYVETHADKLSEFLDLYGTQILFSIQFLSSFQDEKEDVSLSPLKI